jgi:hypothetical protein
MFGLKRKLLDFVGRRQHLRRLPRDLKARLSLADLTRHRLSRDLQYLYCLYFFDHQLPAALRAHRRYFSQNQRGFGEDAFHAMWYLLFQELRPATALEIGVYRGQTVTLWKLLARELGFECQVSCVSPFSAAGDAVSCYTPRVDYYEDMQLNHRHFGLPLPAVCRQFSTAPEAQPFLRQHRWSVVYIDGNHDYEVASQDWKVCSEAVAPGGIVVLDDSALGTDYRPPRFATAGHPGPSRVATEIDRTRFQEILAVGHNRVFQRVA